MRRAADIRGTVQAVLGALLALLLAMGCLTGLRLAGGNPTLGHVVLYGVLMVGLLSPAYLLLAICLGVLGFRAHRGLEVSQAVVVALMVSSLVVIGVTIWALVGISTSRSSTAALGVFALPLLTLIPGVLSFVVTWVLMLIVSRLVRGAG